MKRTIKKVAVIGSGIMGSGIACHFANIGVEVLLLDIVPRELTEAETKKGLTLESTVVRNRLVNEHLNTALKSKPAPIYTNSLLTASQLETLLTIWQNCRCRLDYRSCCRKVRYQKTSF
jgi:glycerol-3-phosphate dehydrogenase